MKFLLDQVYLLTARFLTEQGHDVVRPRNWAYPAHKILTF